MLRAKHVSNPELKGVKSHFMYNLLPQVTTELSVREILDVDAVQGTYTVAFVLQLRWYDKYFDQERFHKSKGDQVFCRSCPYITLDGVVANDRSKDVPAEAATLSMEQRHHDTVTLQKGADPPGVLYKSLRIQATIRSQDKLQFFPFDNHTLVLTLRMWGSQERSDVDYGRVLLPINIKIDLAHQLPDWHVYPMTATSTQPRGKRQQLNAHMYLARESNYYIKNVMIPLGLISTLGFAVYAIRPSVDNVGDRLEAAFTILLTTVS